jgi:hypothetical protein
MTESHFVEHIHEFLVLLTEDSSEVEGEIHAGFPAVGVEGKLHLSSCDRRKLEEVTSKDELPGSQYLFSMYSNDLPECLRMA